MRAPGDARLMRQQRAEILEGDLLRDEHDGEGARHHAREPARPSPPSLCFYNRHAYATRNIHAPHACRRQRQSDGFSYGPINLAKLLTTAGGHGMTKSRGK